MHSPPRLYGRSGELAILETLSARLRQGDGGALVLTGLPGIGRTALLDRTVAAHRERGTGPVLSATAAPVEQRLPYSGLHALLCSAPGPLPLPPDRVLREGIGPAALLVLLRELGAQRPLLVCVDDAHAWDADSRAALGFAARRLGAGSRVAVVIGAGDGTSFAGLPALRLGPLDDDAAAALLDRLTDTTGAADRVDPVVRGELLRAAAGNPRLLTGLTGGLSPDQLAGRTELPYPLPGGEDVLDAYAARLDGLPADTRTLLLLAAAAQEHEPQGAGADAALLLRAATSAGLGPAALDLALLTPAGTAGALQRAGNRVHFSHPLLRRAVLHRASPHHRRAVHGLLATLLTTAPGSAALGRVLRAGGATAPAGAPVLPALVQRACAAAGPDAGLADALEAAAVARGRMPSGRPRWPARPCSPPTRRCGPPGSLRPPSTPGSRATPDGPARCWPGSAGGPRTAARTTCAGCSPCGTGRPPTPARHSSPPPRSLPRTTPAAPWTRSWAPPRPPGRWGTPSPTSTR